MATSQAVGQRGENPVLWMKAKKEVVGKAFEKWMKKQPPPVEVAVATTGGVLQGGVLGGVMGGLSKAAPPPGGAAASPNAMMMGGPLMQARNFAVMSGVHACISTTLKKYRGGVEDLKGNMFASFGSGAAFSMVSGVGGANPVPNAISTGVLFSVFQGGFYMLGQKFGNGAAGGAAGGSAKDADKIAYYRTDQMLDSLGLTRYKRNFRRGLLADTTLPLLTDSALGEVKIPAGPRLLILDHVGEYGDAYKLDLQARSQQVPAGGDTKPTA